MPEGDRFHLKVPGSTSNLGSGFDTVSAALTLYLKLEVTRIPGRDIEWEADWEIEPEENIIAVALAKASQALGVRPGGCRIKVVNEIPLKRGLGSSAAAIVGGIKIAERFSGRILQPEQVFELAYPLEGHPDNLSASLLGGWVISRVTEGRMRAERLVTSIRCHFVLAVPEVEVSTQKAREILPARVGMSDAVFNLQRCALLIHAISSGKNWLLREATQDRLHQSHRATLVPGAPAVLDCRDLPQEVAESLISITVSGSGSTLLAITEGHCEKIGKWMVAVLGKEGTRARFLVLDLDEKGARLL